MACGRWPLLWVLIAGCFIKPSPPESGRANTMFVTSTMLELGGGIPQADATCNTLAQDADPPLPGNYVAWLSTMPVNAIDRLGSARGWVRPDGKPFADTAADIGSNRLFYPPQLDENGSDVGATAQVATGTQADGTDVNGMDCNNDSNANGVNIVFGFAGAGVGEWTNAGTQPCSSLPLRIYCFEIDRDVPVDVPAPTGPFVFVSPGMLMPELPGSGAYEDSVCQNDALAHSLHGTFVAAIADDNTSIDVKLGQPAKPWQRLDGVEIGSDFDTLLAPIDVDDTGAYVGGYVFTGAPSAGEVDPLGDCINWTSFQGSNYALLGDVSQTGSGALDANMQACSAGQGLYCAEVD